MDIIYWFSGNLFFTWLLFFSRFHIFLYYIIDFGTKSYDFIIEIRKVVVKIKTQQCWKKLYNFKFAIETFFFFVRKKYFPWRILFISYFWSVKIFFFPRPSRIFLLIGLKINFSHWRIVVLILSHVSLRKLSSENSPVRQSA